MLLCEMLMKCESSLQTLTKKSPIQNFRKPRPAGALLLHADGRTDGRSVGRTARQTDRQTDMTKLIIVFRNFVNAPKKVKTENAR